MRKRASLFCRLRVNTTSQRIYHRSASPSRCLTQGAADATIKLLAQAAAQHVSVQITLP